MFKDPRDDTSFKFMKLCTNGWQIFDGCREYSLTVETFFS